MEVYIVERNIAPENSNGIYLTVGVFEEATVAAQVAENNFLPSSDVRIMAYPVITPPDTINSDGPDGPRATATEDDIEPRVVWGRRKNWAGIQDRGWLDLRDAPDDPELDEYIRLKKKFENPSQNAPGQQTPVDPPTTV